MSGLVQHLPQQKIVVYCKTLPSSLHSCCMRRSRLVRPKQIKCRQTCAARNKSVYFLVVMVWHKLVSFFSSFPFLILSPIACVGHRDPFMCPYYASGLGFICHLLFLVPIDSDPHNNVGFGPHFFLLFLVHRVQSGRVTQSATSIMSDFLCSIFMF